MSHKFISAFSSKKDRRHLSPVGDGVCQDFQTKYVSPQINNLLEVNSEYYEVILPPNKSGDEQMSQRHFDGLIRNEATRAVDRLCLLK